MPLEETGDRKILSRELSGQRIDLRLALRREGGKMRPVALEKGAPIPILPSTIARLARPQFRHQCRHASIDLPVDEVELPLDLSAGFLHAQELGAAVGRQSHDLRLPCQPAKLDGPP